MADTPPNANCVDVEAIQVPTARAPLAVEALYLPIQTARRIGEKSHAGRNAPQMMEEVWNQPTAVAKR